MHRTMIGFRQDDDGDWVAELSCLHSRHVRHEPPLSEAAWVQDDAERGRRVGELIECGRCDRAELPEGLVRARVTATWDASTMPAALGRDHRVAAGTWGLLEVEVGEVRFRAETDPPIDVVVTSARAQPIPPELDHHVEPAEGARFHVAFLVPTWQARDEGGEAACFAHLVDEADATD